MIGGGGCTLAANFAPKSLRFWDLKFDFRIPICPLAVDELTKDHHSAGFKLKNEAFEKIRCEILSHGLLNNLR